MLKTINYRRPGFTEIYVETQRTTDLKIGLGLNNVDTSLHHIIPGNNIVTMMKNSIKETDTGTALLLNTCISNYPNFQTQLKNY